MQHDAERFGPEGRLDWLAPVAASAPTDFALEEIVALPVIPNPGKIVCVGLNYVAHRLAGSHKTESPAPVLFLRLPESQVGHGQPMVCPRESEQLDFEAER